jgi:glycosyl transferase family 25
MNGAWERRRDPIMEKTLDVPVWVLNLKEDRPRLRFMQKQLRRLKLEYEVIPAVNGTALPEADRRLYSPELAAQCSKRELTLGEIGCMLSHIRIWERMLRERIRELLVLEDDVFIGQGIIDVIRNRKKLPPDWEFVNFSTDAAQAPFGEFITDIYRASRHKEPAVRTSAYLVNRRGARKLLDHALPVRYTADGLTWSTDVTGLVSYGVYPRVAVLSELESSIWTMDKFPQRSFAARKRDDFIIMLKAVARFLGLTPLLKKMFGR